MSTFKKTKVVMLPTNEKSKLVLSFKEKSFNQLIEPKLILLLEEANYQFSNIESKHLYFLSDEEIKEGDWVYNGTEIWQVKSYYGFQPITKKIIATTDKSLFTETKAIGYTEDRARVFYGKEYLSQPSQSFIEKFVEEYNKGNVITEVLVEYEEKIAMDGHTIVGQELKINPKDNTITIRKAKDIWNREEVVLFAEKYARMVQEKEIQLNGYKAIHNHKWIEENL